MDYKGEPTNKGATGPAGPAGPVGPAGPAGATGPAGKDGVQFNYRGYYVSGINVKQYDVIFSGYDNNSYYKTTEGEIILNVEPYLDTTNFSLLQPVGITPYCSYSNPSCLGIAGLSGSDGADNGITIAAGLINNYSIPFTNGFGLSPIGFINTAGVFTLDKSSINAKEGNYKIDINFFIASKSSQQGSFTGGLLIRKNSDNIANTQIAGLLNAINTGGSSGGNGLCYNTYVSSCIVGLRFEDTISGVIDNFNAGRDFSYYATISATYISPIQPVNQYVDNHIAIYDSNTYQFNLSSIPIGTYDIPIMFANNIQDGYSSNMTFISEDLPAQLNPTGLNNAYKNCYYKFEGGYPNPSALVAQSYVKANLNDVSSGGLSVLFQHSNDAVNWIDYTPTVIYTSNYSGDTELCMYWSNTFIPDAVLGQYIRPVIRFSINGSATIPFIAIVSNNFNVIPESDLAGLPNISCDTTSIPAESTLICNTSDVQFTIPTIRTLFNPNSAGFQGGCNYVECQYVTPLGINSNIPPQIGKLFISPNPVQNYNVIATFGIARNSAITDNWFLSVKEGTSTYTIPLVFVPFILGQDIASVSINDTITLPNPYNDLSFTVVNLGLNPIQFTLLNYALNVKAI